MMMMSWVLSGRNKNVPTTYGRCDLKLEKVHDIKFSTSDTQNRGKEPIARHEVRSPNKSINHHLSGLFAEHAEKFFCLT